MKIDSVRRRRDGRLVAMIDGNPAVVADDARDPVRKLIARWEKKGGAIEDENAAPAEPDPEARRRALEAERLGEALTPVMRRIIRALPAGGDGGALRADLEAIDREMGD